MAMVAAATWIALLAQPAGAQDAPNESLSDLLASIDARKGTLSLRPEADGDPFVVEDPTDDFEHVSGHPPQYTAPHFDIVRLASPGTIGPGREFSSVFPRDAGPAWCTENGPAPPRGVTIVCPQGQAATSFSNGATILQLTTAGPIPSGPQAGCGYAIWTLDPNGPAPFAAPEGDADAGNGFNGAWAVFFQPGAGWVPFRFTDPTSTGYQSTLDDGPFVAISGDGVDFWVPTEQADGVTEVNGWAFCLAEGTDASAANSGSDQTGHVAFDAGSLPTFQLVVTAPSPSGSPSESPSVSPSPATQSPSPTADEGSFWPIFFDVVMALGIIALLVGLSLWWRSRKQEDEHGPVGHTRVRETPPPIPPPVAATVDRPDDRAFCDWALYVETPQGKVAVRPATGHECCAYTLRVGTELVSEEKKAQGRQEPDAKQDPLDRLQMRSITSEELALNVSAEVTSRSGRAGDLGWMQGLGEGSAVEPSGENRQTPPGEDPPEVASHFQLEQRHTVRITLESDCPGHLNTYTASGGTEIAAAASMECSNGGPPECPVELTASGAAEVSAEGFLTFKAEHKMGSDPDEAEDLLVPGVLVHTLTDLHDHRERDRGDYAGGDTDSDHATQEGDALALTLRESLSVDAGIIVPRAVWPTTERVTARASTTIHTSLQIQAEMRRVDCVTGGCCGMGECRCSPAFTLRFDPIDAALFVEDRLVGLFPPVKKLGSNEPWELH